MPVRFLLIFLVSGTVLAEAPELGEATTIGGYLYCRSYAKWDHYTSLLESGDPAARKKIDEEPSCGWLGDGITVYVNERMDSLFAVKFSFDGETSYTDVLALDPANAPSLPAGPPLPAELTSPTGMWAVQLRSFGNQEHAERLAADLRKQGFVVFLSKLTTDSGQLYSVRTGPQKDRASAEAMAEKLGKAGHKGQVLPHP